MELSGIPLGKPDALSIESGSSLGGHGRELVREEGDWLGAGNGSWGLSS
jgi:hypothetical protein